MRPRLRWRQNPAHHLLGQAGITVSLKGSVIFTGFGYWLEVLEQEKKVNSWGWDLGWMIVRLMFRTLGSVLRA